MSEVSDRVFSSVLHPTDFSTSSHMAFEHALKIAVANRLHINVVHVDRGKGDGPAWIELPHIRETLERRALLPEDS